MKKIIFAAMLVCGLSGCGSEALVLSGAGMVVQGYIMWKDGEATKYYPIDVDMAYRAVKHTAEQLKLTVDNDESKGKVKGYYLKVGEKDKFKIKVIPVKTGITKICIRINFMGDKPYAELFYKTIDDNLNSIQYEKGKPVSKKFNR